MKGINKMIELVRRSGLIDETWYRREYGDVPVGLDAVEHYLRVGLPLARRPNPDLEKDAVSRLVLRDRDPSELTSALVEALLEINSTFQRLGRPIPIPASPARRADRIVVYSCLFGNYEEIKEPTKRDPKVRYLMFTDAEVPNDSIWQKKCLPYGLSDVRRTSRLPKLLPHRFLPPHDISIYLDSSLTLNVDNIAEMAEQCLNGAEVALYPHFRRNCVYDEIAICRELKIESPQICDAFESFYKHLGVMPNQGLFENTMIVRRNSEAVRELNERWWDYYIGQRDQLSFRAALETSKVSVNAITIGKQVRNNKFVTFTKHVRPPLDLSDIRIFVFIAYAPPSYDQNLGRAYNDFMEMIGEDDIAVFVDHDAMFCDAKWLDLVQRTFRSRRSDDLLLVGMTNRIGKPYQRIGLLEDDHSFANNEILTRAIRRHYRDQVIDITRMTSSSGVVMALSKRTWRKSKFIDGFLKVDNTQHLSIRQLGGQVLMVPGLYTYHFYRADGDLSHARRLIHSNAVNNANLEDVKMKVKTFIYNPSQELDIDHYTDLLKPGEWGVFLRNSSIFCDKYWYPRLCSLAEEEDGSRILVFGNNMITAGAPTMDNVIEHRRFAAETNADVKPAAIKSIEPAHFVAFMIKKDLYDSICGDAPLGLAEMIERVADGACPAVQRDDVYVYAPALVAEASDERISESAGATNLFYELTDTLRAPNGSTFLETRYRTALASRRRVAILTLGFWPNQAGMEMMIHNLALELTRGGDLITLFTPKPSKPFEEIAHTYLLRRYKTEDHLKAIFYEEHTSIPFDVVLVQGAFEAATLARKLAEPFGIPIVLRTHGEDIQIDREANYGYRLNPTKGPVIEDNVRKVDHNVVIGSHIVKEIHEIDPDLPVSVIHNGVNTDAFSDKRSKALHERLGLPEKTRIILTVGRNVKKKSFHYAIDALAEVARSRSDVVLVHAGKPGNGEDLLARAKTLGVADRFHMLGATNYFEMPGIYASSDLFMFPSKTETFGNVTVEAMASALPCVEFDYVVNREKIDHGVNGFIVPYGDVKALAERALELLTDEAKRSRFGAAAREAALRRFSWPSVAAKYRAVFEAARRRKLGEVETAIDEELDY